MDENWYALVIAIKFPVTVEQSFRMLEKGKLATKKRNKYVRLKDEDLFEIIRLKDKGFTHEKIGAMYGMSWNAVRQRIARFRKKVSNRC